MFPLLPAAKETDRSMSLAVLCCGSLPFPPQNRDGGDGPGFRRALHELCAQSTMQEAQRHYCRRLGVEWETVLCVEVYVHWGFKVLPGHGLRSSASPLFLISCVICPSVARGNAVPLHICWICCLKAAGCHTNAFWLAGFPQPRRRQLGLEEENLFATQMRVVAELHCSVGKLAFPWHVFCHPDCVLPNLK